MDPFHITWVTYGSRINDIVYIYNRVIPAQVTLDAESRNEICSYLNEKIREQEYNVIALNVLDDHVHTILACEESEVPSIVGQLKGYSSYMFHSTRRQHRGVPQKYAPAHHLRNRGINPSVVGGQQVDASWEDPAVLGGQQVDASREDPADPAISLPPLSKRRYKDGTIRKLWAKGYSCTYIRTSEQLHNTIEYIELNHVKHRIPALGRDLQHAAITKLEDIKGLVLM